MNISSIERLASLLEQIEVQTIKIDQLNIKRKTHTLVENDDLFSLTLFSAQSNLFEPYIKEIKREIAELNRLYMKNKTDYSKLLLQKIEQQISAILNAIRSNDTMPKAASLSVNTYKKVRIKSIKETTHKNTIEKIIYSKNQLHQKLIEHHEFERRLMNMLTEKDNLRARCKPSESQKLSLEVLTLHQRLGRCRKAISIIERDISLAENKH